MSQQFLGLVPTRVTSAIADWNLPRTSGVPSSPISLNCSLCSEISSLSPPLAQCSLVQIAFWSNLDMDGILSFSVYLAQDSCVASWIFEGNQVTELPSCGSSASL